MVSSGWFMSKFFDDIRAAIQREKNMKYSRAWKAGLIIEANPEWRDLYEDLDK